MGEKTTNTPKKHSHYGHRQRMKEKYLKTMSVDLFEDHELLEMLLFYCCPRKDTNTMAHKMIEKFSTLSNLFEATPDTIMEKCGVTENVAIFISMISRIISRYLTQRWGQKVGIDDTNKARKFAVELFGDTQDRYMYAICLNAQKYLINAVFVCEESVMDSGKYPALVAEAVLANKAVYVIFAQNRPGGTIRPSTADLLMTSDIIDMLKRMGVTVLDHIIVSGTKTYSFSANKKLNLE